MPARSCDLVTRAMTTSDHVVVGHLVTLPPFTGGGVRMTKCHLTTPPRCRLGVALL